MPAPAPRLAAADGEALVMNGWADGPADESADDADVLELDDGFETIADDLTDDDHAHYDRADDERVDEHAFAAPANDDVDAMELADWLASARELAEAARGSEDRSRQALYAAIGRAYDFSLAAADAPGDFAELLADSGLVAQDRAPMTPVVKLVFGADYDKTRLAEYASALSHGHRLGIAKGGLGRFLAEAPGGLKGVVGEERRIKREESGKSAVSRDTPREALAKKLRKLDHAPLDAVAAEGSEFTLLVARRLPTGEVVLLGEVADDVALLERAARKLLS